MNESKNPFEDVLNLNGGNAPDPFEQPVVTPAAGLGSEAAANPFDAPTTPPAVSLGNEAAAPNPFDSPAQAAILTPATVLPTPAAQAQPNSPGIPTGNPIEQVAPAGVPATAQPVTEASPLQASLPNDESGQVQLPFDAAASLEAKNPLAAALAQQQEMSQTSIYAKLPMFEYGSKKEEIEDITQTFEDLRAAKEGDFPELEDANRVSWEVVYGKVRKMVYGKDAKKTKIGEFKSSIEASKEFTDALKKAKDKNPECLIRPKVTAQSKGERMPAYKGVFANFDEAEASGKAICIVPSSDGKVYEIRNEEAGIFTLPIDRCRELSEIKAGFIPALPLIPQAQLMQIITFFRSLLFTDAGGSFEAIANIVWDKQDEVFKTCIPKQTVSAVRADSDLTLSDVLDSDRYVHYMDIHSHNLMAAQFSARDNRDEKATRLYAVIGRLDHFLPEISVRMGCGGRHLPIDPSEVFEPFWADYPDGWRDQVTFSGTVPYEANRVEPADGLQNIHHPILLDLLERGRYGDAA